MVKNILRFCGSEHPRECSSDDERSILISIVMFSKCLVGHGDTRWLVQLINTPTAVTVILCCCYCYRYCYCYCCCCCCHYYICNWNCCCYCHCHCCCCSVASSVHSVQCGECFSGLSEFGTYSTCPRPGPRPSILCSDPGPRFLKGLQLPQCRSRIYWIIFLNSTHKSLALTFGLNLTWLGWSSLVWSGLCVRRVCVGVWRHTIWMLHAALGYLRREHASKQFSAVQCSTVEYSAMPCCVWYGMTWHDMAWHGILLVATHSDAAPHLPASSPTLFTQLPDPDPDPEPCPDFLLCSCHASSLHPSYRSYENQRLHLSHE